MFVTEGQVLYEVFATECLPQLYALARDKVPNIRLAVGRLLHDSILSIGKQPRPPIKGCPCHYYTVHQLPPDYFQTDGKDTFSSQDLHSTMARLRDDPDQDVRYFAGGGTPFNALRQSSHTEDSEEEAVPNEGDLEDSGSHDSEQFQDAEDFLEDELLEQLDLRGVPTSI